MRRALGLAVILVCGAAGSAAAQGVQPPTRVSPGLFGRGQSADPNRARHEVTFGANLLVGYGDLLTSSGGSEGGGTPTGPADSISGTVDGTLRHFYGRAARSITSQLRGYTLAYPDSNTTTSGGTLSIDGSTTMGGRNTVSASQVIGYEPTLILGAFGPLTSQPDAELSPESGGSSGILLQRSVSSRSAATFERRLTTRQSFGATLQYTWNNYLDAVGYDSTTLGAQARYSRSVTRNTRIDTSYRHSETALADADGTDLPITDQSVDAGFSHSRRLSPTRRLTVDGGVGTSRVQTEDSVTRRPTEYWMPIGYGSMRVDLGRSWAVSADYRRSANVLQGVTPEIFFSDALRGHADGRFGRRVDVLLSAGLSNGRVASGGDGQYRAHTGTAQLRYAVAQWCATTVNYQFYRYRLQSVANVPVGLPPEYDRHSVRVGLTIYVPLYGAMSGSQR